ncbi:MAG: DUF4062 domain-containing protein [Bacteroidota bacterium]
MPAPRVFVSSTCYHLKYIRENLKFFIRTIRYEPVLSEEGAVFYDPKLDVESACLTEVPSCQLFILIIGGRYGGVRRGSSKSITNAEYSEAVKARIPIFPLVERAVYDEHRVYTSNRNNTLVDASKISYPAVDSTLIFDFIDEVRGQAVNNALFPFADFEDIQQYLKQHWSSMMYRFLSGDNEAARVGDLFDALNSTTKRVEFLASQLVNAVAGPVTKLSVEFYDYMIDKQVVHDLTFWGFRPSPSDVLRQETLDEFCGKQIRARGDKDESSLYGGGPPYEASESRLEADREEFRTMGEHFVQRLTEEGLTVAQFLDSAASDRPAAEQGLKEGRPRRRQ